MSWRVMLAVFMCVVATTFGAHAFAQSASAPVIGGAAIEVEPPPDTIPPFVTDFGFRLTSDGRLQAGVAFSEGVDPATVSHASVYILDASGARASEDVTVVDNGIAALLPGPGVRGVSYRLVVRSSVRDLYGNVMSADYHSPPFESPAPVAATDAGVTVQTAGTVSTAGTARDTDAAVIPNESASRVLETDTADATPSSAPPIATLEEIGQSVHAIQTRQEQVAERVGAFIASGVDRKLAPAAFSPDERQQELERIKRAALVRGGLAADIIKEAVAQPGNSLTDPRAAEPVLRSSLADIELLIKEESGVSVDLSLGSRAVTHAITQAAAVIKDELDKLAAREGLDLYRDTDNDGVSDYDERYIYQTDPENAHTGGSVLTDGERLLLGLDALTASPEQVPVESPMTAGQETRHLFEVTDISLQSLPRTAADAAAQAVDAPQERALTFGGRSLPNTFVTLYIFSTPIVVTVKTDASGAWSYVLDGSLEDGTHALYVAIVDNGGRIVAKSPPVAFTKTADAASFMPLAMPEPAANGPVETVRGYLFAAGTFAALLFLVIAFVTVGVWHAGRVPPPRNKDAKMDVS